MASDFDSEFPTDEPAVELVLLDRHEPTRLGLGLLLQRQDWVARVHLAHDQQRATLLARRHRPAAAIVDITQVGPLAGTLVASLKEARPGIQIVLTSQCPGATIANPKGLGAAAFLPAGTTVADTARTIQRAILSRSTPEQISPSTTILSPRERDVLALLATGATNREIAESLYLGPDTIKKHASSLYRKLGVRNRTEATQQAAGLLALT
jgi:DNA-binding NarL/FixJ family response regulator